MVQNMVQKLGNSLIAVVHKNSCTSINWKKAAKMVTHGNQGDEWQKKTNQVKKWRVVIKVCIRVSGKVGANSVSCWLKIQLSHFLIIMRTLDELMLLC